VRTLVVSDLHLGGPEGRVWLNRPEVAAALAAAVSEADRLVLLGDAVELRHARASDALAAAAKVLQAVVAGLRAGAEIVVVPGNHDHSLGSGWALRRSVVEDAPLALEQALDWVDGEPLSVLAGVLGASGASVRACYPGVWLRDDVYAMHGHYLDMHTTVPFFERLGAGAMAKLLHAPASAAASVDDYERVLAPLYAWMYPIAQVHGPAVDGSSGPSARAWELLRFGHGVRRLGLIAGAGFVIAALNRFGMGPLSASVLRGELAGAELPAFAAVLASLGLREGYVLFGHTHRAGPGAGDRTGSWTGHGGVRMINTGSWVYDETFMSPAQASVSPYRPGFAVWVDSEPAVAPELVNLLG
jgi:UDP-2,3-diacylglucosamine pyrophosphatase LpxH